MARVLRVLCDPAWMRRPVIWTALLVLGAALGAAISGRHDLGRYWAYTGGNIAAMPLEAAVAAVAGWLARKPLARLARWARGELHAETHAALRDMRVALADIRAEAAKTRRTAELAHQIAADTHEHLTGRRHPDAPAGKETP